MAGSSAGFHEGEDRLSPATRDLHRALVSLMEELEAMDWYQQRIDAGSDAELRAILAHNRDEEAEHAAMLIEWIRRRAPFFEAPLREYLFTDGDIPGRERANATPPRLDGGPRPGPRPLGALRDA